MKAIVLSFDRHRAITEHMMLQYERLWPDHPFRFRIPYQTLNGPNSARAEYIHSPGGRPADIPATVLQLVADLDDEEWVYWCSDDKYAIRLRTRKISQLMHHVRSMPEVSGLLFCRSRVTLDQPELSLHPGELVINSGDVLLERKAWYQIWLHQFLRVKVLRQFFSNFPALFDSAKQMDELKNRIEKPDSCRLFVTRENLAVFGESTQRGHITQNCLESISRTDIKLPEWFHNSNGQRVTIGELAAITPLAYWRAWRKRHSGTS